MFYNSSILDRTYTVATVRCKHASKLRGPGINFTLLAWLCFVFLFVWACSCLEQPPPAVIGSVGLIGLLVVLAAAFFVEVWYSFGFGLDLQLEMIGRRLKSNANLSSKLPLLWSMPCERHLVHFILLLAQYNGIFKCKCKRAAGEVLTQELLLYVQ
eukprot:551900-Pelagomonas_calceolata.AAC.1